MTKARMTRPSVFTLVRGRTPLLLSMPHSGTELPVKMVRNLTPAALMLPDTDWHLPTLYDFARHLGATILIAHYHRYLVDLNRSPTNETLYHGQRTTEFCPTQTFDGENIYSDGDGPSPGEIAERKRRYWDPYHAELANQLEDIKRRFGYAMLYDCHSIRSQLPRLFNGTLPDLNLGTVNATSAATSLIDLLREKLRTTAEYTSVVDGRFIGGYITRAFGRPSENIHAVQMEIAQTNYMREVRPYRLVPERMEKLRRVLAGYLEAMLDWRPPGLKHRPIGLA